LKVLQFLKGEAPASEICLIGFSLGGNISLKLAGELGAEAGKLVNSFIAVCAPLDLAQAVVNIQMKRNRLYHSYYLKNIRRQARGWNLKNAHTLYEIDDLMTAPLWGYKGADEYYQECSSIRFLPNIQQSTHLLFAEDDPFISLECLQGILLSNSVQVWTTAHGGHMGFLGRGANLYWMDHLLLNWIDGDFRSNLRIKE
jgi:predicted alpha/beta-fold hydrolase